MTTTDAQVRIMTRERKKGRTQEQDSGVEADAALVAEIEAAMGEDA